MLLERFIDYAKFETTSDESSETTPSTTCQLMLAKHLYEQLKVLGLDEVKIDEYGYVYGYLKGDLNMPTIGLLAHMDTSSNASGKNVNPQVIEKYDGEDIKLRNNIVTSVERFPVLKDFVGKTLVTSDGTTLLGADDKAGIAIIMELLDYLINNPEYVHCPIRVCFSPDEEIGRGMDKFDYGYFKVDFAYTIDGEKPNYCEYENFNASSAHLTFTGVPTHTGSAKDKMVNALKLAYEFNSLLDPNAVPEKTEGYEGFNHLEEINGSSSGCKAYYLIRNHDEQKLHMQENLFRNITDFLNKKYGYECVELEIKDGYRNMKMKFDENFYPIQLVKDAMEKLNMDFKTDAIRGGTDGAVLTNNGILCPNLGNGGAIYHSIHEVWCKQEGEEVVKLLLKMINIAKKGE